MNKPVTIYPAIDLKGGVCVRLLHGRMADATVYNKDPANQAARFKQEGFDWVHIVDLDGAFAGTPKNAAAVESIIQTSTGHTQLGGGIRDMGAVERWLGVGVTRVILGTAAVNDPAFVKSACQRFPGQIVIGVDARDGRVKTDGWDGDTSHTPLEIVNRFADFGAAAVVFTDIARDGALGGVNVEATAELADAVAIPVIASGGVAGVEDITAIARTGSIEGVIIGRALYDGRLDPADALNAAKIKG